MSHLKYSSYDGVGKANLETYGYNQAVRLGDRIEISGQGKPFIHHIGSVKDRTENIGGWDPKTGAIDTDVSKQIDQAFENVDLTLKDAGGKGWSQVCPCVHEL
jgi:enamine deaminase RidA (YjgF/YER057c/UK114 family)